MKRVPNFWLWIEECLTRPERLTPWEKEFLLSVQKALYLSSRQKTVLKRVHSKLFS